MHKKSILAGIVAGLMVAGAAQNTFAHTRLNVPTATEGERAINHIMIGHSCNETTHTIGTSVVFPSGVGSTILVDGVQHSGSITDFLTNYGNNASLFYDRSAFDYMDEKTDANGNVVGFWAGGGSGMPGNLSVALPFRLTAASIEPSSCAASVKIYISIVDICEITGVNYFGEGTVELWTHAGLGTPYDRDLHFAVDAGTDPGPASFTINRDLANNPLPEDCGEGVAVEMKPSAAQINRDMPIKFNGQQVWPLP
ncbi:hypothetical protein SAMN05216326_11843 [Nitrosomonas marina]|uniref:Uncharacterized protein n=1 Tax=Nitrosomonas marina TaxID=917 RepID=A0A1I0D5D8_9PROT|nr:hypothetical protein [Nitrosomonas marina]SET27441.1 hypothetical protein SAMN05216326_11843 [Nitrosomonas marina]